MQTTDCKLITAQLFETRVTPAANPPYRAVGFPLVNQHMEIVAALAKNFCEGEYDYRVEDSLWTLIFEYLHKNFSELEFNANLIHTLWTVNGGHLRRKVGNDQLTLSILLKYLPGYSGEGLILYRGECKFLYEENKIGFCWTPKIEVATIFASGLNSIESGGFLLKAYAPTEAIMASPNDHSIRQMGEFEYTCNPNLLEGIEIIESFNKLSTNC
jgi:hypothetical protein